MRILVTGAKGHVARYLIPLLKTLGHHVFELDHVPDFKPDYYCVDVRDGGDMAHVFRETMPDVVYHLAAMVSRVTCERAPDGATAVNVGGAGTVARLCEEWQSRLIHISTSEVYGPHMLRMSEDGYAPEPNNHYGLTKYLGEQLVRYLCPSATIVRPFMLYSESEAPQDNRSAMIRFIRDIIAGNRFHLHTDTTRSWLHMTDAARLLAALLGPERDMPDLLNIGSPEVRTMFDLVKMIEDASGKTAVYDETPLPIQMTAHKDPVLDRQEGLGVDLEVSLEEGIRRVVGAMMDRSRS